MNAKWKEKNDLTIKNEDIQDSKTFLRWANFMLRKKSRILSNLQNDIKDGSAIIELFECLTNNTISVNSINAVSNSQHMPLDRFKAAIDYMKIDNIELCENIGENS